MRLGRRYQTGTDRLISAAETVARARRATERMGITRVANVTGLDVLGIPVVTACRPNARSLAVSQGKGLDLDAAKASALMECIELFHAEHVEVPLRLATERELAVRSRVVRTERLPRLTISSYHQHATILWVQGVDLGPREPLPVPTWVPYEMVHTNYTLPLPTGSGSFVMSSNGLASGNDLAEAVMHGLCEVIERDASTLWVLAPPASQNERRLDLDTVDDPACRDILDRYRAAGVLVGVWETTTDVGLASFLCMIVDRELSPLRTLYPTHGMGCHPVREIALSRALTEAAQSRLTFITGSRDDSGRGKYSRAQDEAIWRAARERLDGTGSRRFQEAPSVRHDNVDDDLAYIVDRLRGAGFDEIVSVDLSKPDLGFPVARVVVPGLEPLWEVPGYSPGPRARQVLARHLEGAK